MELQDPPADGKSASDTDAACSIEPSESGWLSQPASELQDHRRRGQWKSRYPAAAWWQIGIEFGYSILVLLLAAAGLLWIGYYVAAPFPTDQRSLAILNLVYPRDRTFLLWVSVGLSGVIGGASFSLKWLYHSVAKWSWNQDRVLWRLIVPVLSGTLAVFVAMMIGSGVVSFLNSHLFSNFYGALGTGFLIGYFSDNVLAALQNLAVKWFGTVDKRYSGRSDEAHRSPQELGNPQE